MSVDDLLASKLRHDPARSSDDWGVWEHKTLNIHRGVLHWRPAGPPPAYADISRAVREKVAATYRRSWWRGFAFGVAIELDGLPDGVEAAADDIDTRDNRKGTWQFTVLAVRQPKVALAIHTWTRGYLTPVHDLLLAHYEGQGYRVASLKKEKDALMRFLAAVSGLRFPGFER